MGAMARIYLACRRTPETPVGWTQPAILWTALAAGVLLKGPLVLMFVVLAASHVVGCRPFRTLAVVAASRRRFCLDGAAGPAVVRRDRCQIGRRFLRAGGRPRHARQGDERAGGAWRAARILFRAVLGHVLAGLGAGGTGGADDLAIAPRAWRTISPRLACAVLARVRGGDDQVAALRAAALSGDCDFDRGHSQFRQPVQVALAGPRHHRMVPVSRRHRDCCADRLHHVRRRPRAHRLAFLRGRRDMRPVRLVALRSGWCRARAVAWNDRFRAGRGHGLCGDICVCCRRFFRAR